MTALFSIFIRSLIFAFIPFFLLGVLFEWPETPDYGLLLNEAFLMALLFAGMLTIFQFLSIRTFAGKEWQSAHYGLRQSETFDHPIILDALADVLAREFDIHRSQMTVTEDTITFKTGLSASSLGEIITVELVKDGDREKTYRISSRPRVKLVVMDFGRNFRNVQMVVSALGR